MLEIAQDTIESTTGALIPVPHDVQPYSSRMCRREHYQPWYPVHPPGIPIVDAEGGTDPAPQGSRSSCPTTFEGYPKTRCLDHFRAALDTLRRKRQVVQH